MYPQSFIEQVKNSTNMLQLAKQYTEMKETGPGIWQGICPHPDHKDTDPSFTVWSRKNSWCCYGCHHGSKDKKHKIYGSDCFAFIQWISKGKTNWKEAVEYLADQAGIPLPDDENQELYDHKKSLASSYMASLHGKSFNYLVDRGLNKQDMVDWMVGFDGRKITFPLFDKYRNILGFSKRWLEMPEDRDDKYRNSANSKIFNKSYYLYGIHLMDMDFDEIRITEGCMDVILPHKYGVKNIVAPLGTSFTEGHVEVLKAWGKTPVFCMDGDPAGFKSINKSIDMLAEAGMYSKILILPEGMDMADMANELKYDLEEYISDHAMTYGYYKIKDLINIYDSKTNELKLKLYPAIIEVLNTIPTEAEKVILKNFIKDKLQLEL